MLYLDPLPPAFRRGLDDDEREALHARYPAVPSSPREGCVTCLGRGTFRWYGPDGEPAEYECRSGPPWRSCEEQWLMYRRMLFSGVGKAYQRLSWADFLELPESHFEYVMSYMDHLGSNLAGGQGMILWGDRGRGKSMCAALLVKEVVSTGVRAYMDTLQGIVDAYTAGWTSKADRDGFLKYITNVAVLAVDDIGREYQGGRGVNTRALEQVLRHRTQHGLVTIVTTNYTPKEIADGYGGHIVSVLSESSDVLEFGGVDLRPKILERQKRERDLGLTRPLVIR